MSNLLNISSSPHVRDKSSTKSIMWDVFLALMPATIVGIYNFGYKAAILIVACVAAAVLTEYIWQKAMKLPVTVSDGSWHSTCHLHSLYGWLYSEVYLRLSL